MMRREHNAGSGRPDDEAHLPPHAAEAEAAVLGCILWAEHLAADGLRQAREFFQGEPQVFFDLRHRKIFEAMSAVWDMRGALDGVLVWQWLTDTGNLDTVGGTDYWTALSANALPASMLPYYLKIVWEKFIARRLIQSSVEAAASAQTAPDLEPVLARVEAQVIALKAQASRHGGVKPARLKSLADYENEYWNEWFGSQEGEPGVPLPFEFPFKIRTGEMTFLIAEKGAGKSTLMSYIRLHLMRAGMKACVASMEMKPATTIKIAAAQLLGMSRLPDNDWGHKQARIAYDWLRERLLIYDFLGIADWRDILHTFEYAAGQGCNFFEIDSVMRIGIPDDDLAQQGFAAATFAGFAINRGVHLAIVNHLNKSDRSVKQRSRGSQQWIDNSSNVISLELNEKKHEKLAELHEERKKGIISQADYETKRGELADKYDSHFVLHNQRFPGSRQNGSRYLFFNRDGLQLHENPHTASVNWLQTWCASARPPGEKKDTN